MLWMNNYCKFPRAYPTILQLGWPLYWHFQVNPKLVYKHSEFLFITLDESRTWLSNSSAFVCESYFCPSSDLRWLFLPISSTVSDSNICLIIINAIVSENQTGKLSRRRRRPSSGSKSRSFSFWVTLSVSRLDPDFLRLLKFSRLGQSDVQCEVCLRKEGKSLSHYQLRFQ